ncbi:MAG: phosphopantothenoylcysteine decarboxylase [Candidatus Omnitrophota bacterium]
MPENRTDKKALLKILVTAGPTLEPIDPVRYISNRSTGEAGYAIARAAEARGFEVCLITGPVSLVAPQGVETVKVTTAIEMRDRVMERVEKYDCLIMAAAVCDFRPEKEEENKIKKTEELTLRLTKNPDILSEVGTREGLIKVGFALETEKLEENASAKLKAKDLDLIVVNAKTPENDPFGPEKAGGFEYAIIDRECKKTEFTGLSKEQIAEEIISRVANLR